MNIFELMRILQSGNPDIIMQQMMENNSKFRDFVAKNKDKSPDQIAKEYGVDISALNSFIK